ncbi:CIR protein PIR protein [Plasmodium vinckei vinckei]|uniref:CIR protein PIR protein n=1 Tax=Plasmodium vinckei vinckei TaxID=54757 RepID=A0A449BMP7_PLAVN|nr:CIR protein PIR protein [Plasmodium vinckei vinckei]VEV54731.1 CIR protein PIR protein [Plasmodium vinckei vinckei]
MAQPNHTIKDLYSAIKTISNYFGEEEEKNGAISLKYKEEIHNYCHYESNSGDGKCSDYFQMTSSGVIHLLKSLEKYGLENDKLAEYAILWLSYKLNIKTNNNFTNLNEFYTSYIETNNYYNEKIKNNGSTTYKDIINRKKDLMDNNEISKFDAPFNILYFLYYEISDELPDCDTNLSFAKMFSDDFEKLNKDSNNIENSSYNKLLSTLSDDYNNLINKCPKFPSLTELTPKKSSTQNPAEKSVKDSGQTLGKTPEGTLSSSSILNTVIPGLSTFAIPVFLGVAYKTIYKKKNKKSKEENET